MGSKILLLMGLALVLLNPAASLPFEIANNDHSLSISTGDIANLDITNSTLLDSNGQYFTNLTKPETWSTCYAADDPDFTPTIPGFDYQTCNQRLYEIAGHLKYDQVEQWWSEGGKPSPQYPSSQVAGISRRQDGCSLLVISSLVLDQLVKQVPRGPFGLPIEWKVDWGPRRGKYIERNIDSARWGDVIDGFQNVLECVNDGLSGHKIIGAYANLCLSLTAFVM
ncbi:uncharacterized protein KY384_000425 [Bacidia gigantensis]|uniref:uncharacterized protein n=1 Tax=Bacidia gigantensis TaxID=2732470 RepID=UPI001D05B6A8|nr:uncharacterized protein KY384_000425 [Bacidia gigantensis]KAG8525665.1 hypothetical protein KY384_000425 [Bacidia gigantensis]